MPVNAADRERVLRLIDQRAGDIVEYIRDLVRIPSETHPPGGDEKDCQILVAESFREMGLDQVDVFEPDEIPGIEQDPGWWPGLDYRDRPNVVGVWKGTGGGRSLLLNGHIDVVPAGPRELWDYDPYGADVVDGKIYGRGAVDMKGPLGAAIMVIRILKEGGIKLKGDLILASTVNEEMGGYNGSLACIRRGYVADAGIVVEPTSLKIEPGTKGLIAFRMKVKGEGAHSHLWWMGTNALDKILYLRDAMKRWESMRTEKLRSHPLYGDPEIFPTPAIVEGMYHLSAGHPHLMSVPQEAVADFHIDMVPGEDPEAVAAEFERYLAEVAAQDPWLKLHPPTLERVAMRGIIPTQMELDHPLIDTLRRNFADTLGKEPKVCGFESACEAMMFNLYSDMPTMVFGPGDLYWGHRQNEHIEIAEVMKFSHLLALTVLEWCGYEA